MSTDTATHLADLERAFFHDTSAPRAVALLEMQRRGKAVRPSLVTTLRHHDDPPGWVPDELTRIRDAFDYLLEFYGILEIASLIGYVPAALPARLTAAARRHLTQPAVQCYYEEKYPQLLPRLLLLRLSGRNKSRQKGPRQKLFALFRDFLVFVDSLNNDDAVETFQWFLDDGVRGEDEYGLEDTLRVMRNRKAFFKHYLRPTEDQTDLDLSLHGFQRFVDFCVEFERFLTHSSPYPLLQSAMWHFFQYWFDQIGDKVGEEVIEAAESFLRWPAPGRHRAGAKREVRQYVMRVRRAMNRLTGGSFGLPLQRLAAHL